MDDLGAKIEVIAMNSPLHLRHDAKPELGTMNGFSPETAAGMDVPRELISLPRKVYRNLQDYGWHVTGGKTLAYLLRSIYFQQVYRIYRIDFDARKPFAKPGENRLIFRILSVQDVDLIAQIEDIAEWLRGRLMTAIATGQLCLVSLDGNTVAGFNLINLNLATIPVLNLKRKLRRGSAWSEHIAVKKEYRKMGLGSTLRLRIFEELKCRGFCRLYGGTLQSNIASLSLARSVGFREIADVHYRKFLSVEKWWYTRVRE
jgi:GNAT superfamily N-acetyltransferase